MAVLTGYDVLGTVAADPSANISAAFDSYTNSLWPPQGFTQSSDVVGASQKREIISEAQRMASGPPCGGAPYCGLAYSDDFYHKIYLIPRSIDLGTFTDTTRDFVVWNAYFNNQEFTVINTSAEADDGLTLTGNSSGTMPGISVYSYTLEAGADGNPALDITYTWDFVSGAVADPVLTVIGQRVILLPWHALTPMSKTLSWKTGITRAYAAEQRRGLRRAPRQAISYRVYLPEQGRENLETRLQNLEALYAVPMWYEIEAVGALTAGALTINLDTDNKQLYGGGLIYIFQNSALHEAKTIDTVGVGFVTLTSGIANNYTDAQVMAAVAGYNTGANFTRRAVDENFAALDFAIIDYYELPAGSYTQYKGLDVLLDPSVAAEPVPMQVVQSRVWRDNGIGPVAVGATENRARVQDLQKWIKKGRADKFAMEQWLRSKHGQRVPFYQPTWNNDYKITADIGDLDAFIDVETTARAAPFEIMIELTDGTQFFREVLTKSVQGGGHRLNLDSALGQNITTAQVARISLLRLTRHASDAVTIEYEGDLARAQIPTTTH